MTKLLSLQFIFRKVYAKFAVRTFGNNQVIKLQKLHFWMRSWDVILAKVPNCLFSFITFFAVLPCEYFLAGTKVAVCFVKSNTFAFVLTRQIATWRL